MKYQNIKIAKFIDRPNRFIANIEIDGEKKICHVKNTGRCKELLSSGTNVWVEHIKSPNRKTEYDLVCVEKDGEYINIDSQAPNKIFKEWAQNSGHFGDDVTIRSEVKYKNSRFDFYIESGNRKIFTEVKGVTLKSGDVALFPDAPTERGVKHINELSECIKDGYEAQIVFIIQMKGVNLFSPNNATHPQFGISLKEAEKNGVGIMAIDCNVTPDEVVARKFIEVSI